MAKFSVPNAQDRDEAERVWKSTRKFMEEQGHVTSGRRIRKIKYTHNGKGCADEIGGTDRYGRETVLVILEAESVYLCCTANRGVLRGEPILVGKRFDTFAEEFEPDEQ
ncbi:MAG: hypothetical protein LAO07_18150 [Acidobacteriia bacterium]|nr:hypothetical protein [Terriglobia bacterium]